MFETVLPAGGSPECASQQLVDVEGLEPTGYAVNFMGGVVGYSYYLVTVGHSKTG